MQFQRIFSPSVVNEWKAGVNRSTLHRYTYGPVPASIAVAGLMALNQSNALVENGTSYSLIDNLSITRGRHAFRMGIEVRRAHVNVADPVLDSLTVNYTSRQNFLDNRGDSVPLTCS